MNTPIRPDRFAAAYLRLLIVTLFFAAVSFPLFRCTAGAWIVTRPASSGFSDGCLRFLRAEGPLALFFALTAFSAATVLCRGLLVLGCGWRGVSFGCVAAALADGRLAGAEPTRTLVCCFLITAAWLFTAAASGVYHPSLLRSAGDGDAGVCTSNCASLLKSVLPAAGAAFLIRAALL